MESNKENIKEEESLPKIVHEVPGPPKKRSKVFLIILVVMVILGAWFGITKYTHAQHHEETDDAQVEADIFPVIPRVSGYVKEIRVKDNQYV
ncbi:MAG: HlyD family secretion protein, partial [Ginsengibacter sp.]